MQVTPQIIDTATISLEAAQALLTRLLPGRRTSYPHAESTEQEFVYVLQGKPEVWIDGALHPIAEGDSVAFPAGTGICHTFITESGRLPSSYPTRRD